MNRGRRQFLAGTVGAAAALAFPARVFSLGEGSLFRFAQIRVDGGNWNPRPNALPRMAWELDKRTSISVDTETTVVSLEDDDLHETPFLYLAGDREFALPSTVAIDRLRSFLAFGGFLLIDSAEGAVGGAFDGSVRQLLKALYPPPETGFSVVPKDHVLYKSFYLLDAPVGRLAVSGAIDAVFRDGRIAVAYTQNDLAGAWARDDLGSYVFPCEPGGERQRELAFRLGTNIVMYSLCLDYKSDQVHVPFILKRRRWRPNDGAEEQ